VGAGAYSGRSESSRRDENGSDRPAGDDSER
jgi:hypothetical protein